MTQNIRIYFAIAFFIIFTLTACEKNEAEGQLAVDAFLAEMSPELVRKIDQIKEEISITEEKIQKLSELKLKHPNYAGRIETSRRQWKVLQEKLKLSLKEIREVVENTYITYELNKIQGGNQFNKISEQLLSSADSVLASAGLTKNAIEQALNEVENQPLPSLDNTQEEVSVVKKTVEAIEEPPTEFKPQNTRKNQPFLCDIADAHLNLMMMVISTDKAEQDALKIEIDKASTEFEKALATLHEIDNDQFTALQEIWTVYKNTRETEIIPAIRAGDNDKALKIANGIQAERMKIMKDLIQTINGDNCDIGEQ
ncbi:MAG: MCP four helix bundle domain-containing protein [Pseudomonadota bacterium]